MFIFSKLFWLFFEPSNMLFLIILIGVALLWSRRWRKLGRGLLTSVGLFLICLSFVPMSTFLIRPLENRFPLVKELPEGVTGVITLGGAVDQFSTKSRDSISLSDHSERLTEFVGLALRYPELKLVYTGGSASLSEPDVKETLVARRLFNALGVAPSRIIYEDRSRNTHENAIYTKQLISPLPNEKWVLITSAFHMPRAVGVFRKNGWDVIPFPVSYMTHEGNYTIWRSPFKALARISLGIHEWVGLLVYRLLGRSDDVFPAP